MATEKIGVVKVLIGEAIATDPSGEKRPLDVEYLVHPGETITTGDFSKVEIQFSDGTRLDLGRNAEMVVDADILNPNEFTVATASEIEVIQAAIEAGYDPSTITQAPAAGTADNDGSSFVALNHDAPRVTPVSGFETTGLPASSFTPPLVDFLLDPDGGIVPPSQPPQANPDQASITEDGPINPVVGDVLSNDSDPDGDQLSVVQVNGSPDNVGQPVQGQFGTVVISPDGTYSYELDNNLPAVQALNEGETLTETFTYTNSDGELTASSDLTITIQGADEAPVENNPPVANPDTASITEDGEPNPITGNVLSNDSDPDGDQLTVVQVNGSPDNVGQPLQGQFGILIVNADGTYSYQVDNSLPAVQALNDGDTLTETFTYTNSDGELTASSDLTITIQGADEAPAENNPPVANPDIASITEDGEPNPITGNVLNNDSDPDSDQLTVVQVNGSPDNVGQPLQGQFGTVVINPDGTFSYELDNSLPAVQELNDGDTLTDTFSYTNSDGEASATANLVISIEGADESVTTGTIFDFGGDIALPEGFLVDSTPFVFNVNRSGDTSDAGSVNFSFNAGDTDANDFIGGRLPQGSVLDFAAGETEKTITINVRGDIALEGDESFSLSLNSPSGTATEVSIGQGTVTGTILGDDNETFDPGSTDTASESALASNDIITLEDVLVSDENTILADPPSLPGGITSGAAGAESNGSSPPPVLLGSYGASLTNNLLEHNAAESNVDLV